MLVWHRQQQQVEQAYICTSTRRLEHHLNGLQERCTLVCCKELLQAALQQLCSLLAVVFRVRAAVQSPHFLRRWLWSRLMCPCCWGARDSCDDCSSLVRAAAALAHAGFPSGAVATTAAAAAAAVFPATAAGSAPGSPHKTAQVAAAACAGWDPSCCAAYVNSGSRVDMKTLGLWR